MIDLEEQSKRQLKTAAHYDAHPLDFMTPSDEAAMHSVQPAPFLRFVVNHIHEGLMVAEIGCGPGRATLFLEKKASTLWRSTLVWSH
jgi:hypothetical protein